ncbi:MAG: TSUP family transporter [Planctomycetota bacterium]|nr:TSUP family transporter [Planctomycetota bacterium]
MEYLLVCATALFAAGLTLFSGFGLGTLLLPAFLLFFPPSVAVAATAVVHLSNNLFKLALLGRYADRRSVLWFGLPAALAAVVGALLLGLLAELEPLAVWHLGSRPCPITPLNLLFGAAIAFFALFDLLPRLRKLQFERRWLPVGGVLSGFFGGLSGHQGALRSAFLIKLGLGKEAFLATGIVCAVIVDVVRLPVYLGGEGLLALAGQDPGPVVCATIAAFVGSYVGRRCMDKVKVEAIQLLVGVMLLLLAAGLASGLLG